MQCQRHVRLLVLESDRIVYLYANTFTLEDAQQVRLSAAEELERLRLVGIVCTCLDEGSERSIGRAPSQSSKYAGLDIGCLDAPLLRSTAVLEAERLLRKLEQRLAQRSRLYGRRNGCRSRCGINWIADQNDGRAAD